MRILTITFAMLLLLTTPICAQTEHQLEVGRRLRIRTMGSRTECVLEHISADTLIVSGQNGNGLQKIAFDQVDRVDVRVPRSAGWGAIRGAAIGVTIGALVGGIYAISTWDDVNADCGGLTELCSNTASGLRFIGVVTVFGTPPMLIGGVVGAMFPGERWQPVKLPGRISMRIDEDGALAIQYSHAF